MANERTYNVYKKYFSRSLTMEEMSLLYKANNIIHDKCVLFYDFIDSMGDLIYDTYLGDDVMGDIKEVESHFDWCIDKTILSFQKEGINFNKSEELKGYLFTFYYGTFYGESDRVIATESTREFWFKTFNMDVPKTKSEVDIMVEIYKIMDSAIEMRK